MKKLLALVSLLMLLAAFSAHAQDAAGWRVVVYADGANALQVFTADGLTNTIGAGSLPLRVGAFPSTPLVAITPDLRALASLSFTPYASLNVVVAAYGECCKTIRLADTGVVIAQTGGFSPNGRRFVVSYLRVTDEAANLFESAVVTVDVELGAVVSRLERPQIGGDFAWVRNWGEAGIDYLPFCYGCDDLPAGSLSRWDPETGSVTPNVGYYSAAQDVLASSGETVAPVRRADFPLPISESVQTTPNVVSYASGESIRAIYYNPRSLVIDSAHWVADGWQILVEHPNATMLLDRSGVQRSVSTDTKFLVGTPDGWLATRQRDDATELVHFKLTNLGGEVVGRFYHPITVLQAPALGASASRGGFTDAVSPVNQLTCPNALPPRLVVGGGARVVGGGVNMRSQPSVSSSPIYMVTTERLTVIGGPNCDPTGIAWWQVGIGGVRGWMAESSSGVYLLEPVLN